jgi:hypothetical protein
MTGKQKVAPLFAGAVVLPAAVQMNSSTLHAGTKIMRRSPQGRKHGGGHRHVLFGYPNNSREPGFQEFSEIFLGALDQLSAVPHAPNYTDENIYVNAKYGVVPAAFFCQTRGCMIQYAAPPILLLRGRCCQN